MYDAQPVRREVKDEGQKQLTLFEVTCDLTGTFIGCMVCMTVTMSDDTKREYWYPDAEMNDRIGWDKRRDADKDAAVNAEDCLERLLKEYKRRQGK